MSVFRGECVFCSVLFCVGVFLAGARAGAVWVDLVTDDIVFFLFLILMVIRLSKLAN